MPVSRDSFESVARGLPCAAIGGSRPPFDWLRYVALDPSKVKTLTSAKDAGGRVTRFDLERQRLVVPADKMKSGMPVQYLFRAHQVHSARKRT